MDHHASDLTSIALVATVAVLIGLAFTRLRQPAIVGYILAGVVLGPTGLGLVSSSENVTLLAELGVLMLLFLIGMELSLRAFVSVLGLAMAVAGLQVAIALGVAFGFGGLLGWPVAQSIVLGFIVSLSSTAVAIKMLEDIDELRTRTGRVVVGVLIAQDLAVVPMLVVVDALGGEGIDAVALSIKLALAVGVLAGLIWFLSRREKIVLPSSRWMRGKGDLIPLAALAFCFLAATVTGLLGLSPAYGAFLAGLVIGASTDRKAVMRATHPIQSVLLVVFFLSVGLLLDLEYIAANLGLVIGFVLAALVIKTAVNVVILHLLGEPWERAYPAGVIMGQIGEFSFVLAAAGIAVGAIDPETQRLALAVIALSLLLSPLWLVSARRFHAIAAGGVTSLRAALAETYDAELTALETTGSALARGGRAAWRPVRALVRRRRGKAGGPAPGPEPAPTPAPAPDAAPADARAPEPEQAARLAEAAAEEAAERRSD